MVNFSIGLAQDIMVNRLIGSIRVSMTKKVYETITNESHYSVKTKLLTRKWVIALENSK